MKRCCGNSYSKMTRTCSVCKQKLPSIDTYRKEAQQNLAKQTENRRRRRDKPELTFHLYQEPSQKKINLGPSTSSSVPLIPKENVFYLDPIHVNPGSKEATVKILEKLHKQFSIGVKTSDGTRNWLVVMVDGGPYECIRSVIHNEPDKSKYEWLLLRAGPLHEEWEIMDVHINLMWYITGRECAQEHSWLSKRQQKSLRTCKDKHKTADFMKIHHTGIILGFWVHFRQDECRCVDTCRCSIDQFLKWGQSHPEDPVFTFIFSMEVVYGQAYFDFHEGARTANRSLRRIARLTYLPIILARGCNHYDTLMLEMDRDDCVAPLAVRELLDKIECFAIHASNPVGEGGDARQEEVQRGLVRSLPHNASPEQWVEASRLMRPYEDLRKHVFEFSGKIDREMQPRTELSMDEDIGNMI